jgi:hypothetical protein
LFTDSIVFGENLADYEAFHDQMLTELDPVGAVETTMVERIISLWWWLKRAERMQNEVIEDMIVHKVTNNSSRRCREYDLADHGLRPDDPEYDLDSLALGRIASNDWSCTRILDRMLLYERRIENIVVRLTKELRKQQLMRRIEQREIGQETKGNQLSRRPLKALCNMYIEDLKVSGRTAKHRKEAERCLNAVTTECGFQFLKDTCQLPVKATVPNMCCCTPAERTTCSRLYGI